MKILTNRTISSFTSRLLGPGVSPSDALSKIDTALSFVAWLVGSKRISESDAVRFKNELYRAKGQFARQKAPSNSIPIKYVGLSLAALSLFIIGIGIYLRFYKNVKTPFAYSTAPIRAGRIISFQGRLTDTLGNPITAPIDITYNFYTASTGGSPITSSTRVCTTSPDQDGVFNSIIGNDAGGSGATLCNVEIPSSIFTENTNVYLGVKVGSDPTELSPRQQIANVGYAINSETLQGMPPGQGVSTIPFINQSGDMLIAASNPGLRSTYASSTFVISSAQATTIQSAGSGDITLSATEGGVLRFKTYSGSIQERMTILSGGNVGIGIASPRALLDVSGNATISGSLVAGGQVKIGEFSSAPVTYGNGSTYYDTTTNTIFYWNGSAWMSMGGIQYWQRTLGSVAPTNITDAINVGAIASGSALVHLPGTTNQNAWFNLGTGNVGIGTTTPNGKVQIAADPTGYGNTNNYTGQLELTGATNPAKRLAIGYNTTGNVGYIQAITNGSSFDNLALNALGGSIGIGNSNPGAKLDIGLAGSALGTLRLAGNTSGYTQIQPAAAAGSWTFTLPTSGGVNGYVLSTDGSGTTSWAATSALGTNYWNIANGSIFPVNATLDAFIGGTSTASADFAFLNVSNGTPTASISGTIANVRTFLDGNGNLSTTNRQNLTLGNSATYNSTGNILLNPNGTGYVGIGTTGPGYPLDVNGNVRITGTGIATGWFAASSGFKSGNTSAALLVDQPASGNLQLAPNGAVAMTLLNNGNVGIGTTNPLAKLDITGNLNVST